MQTSPGRAALVGRASELASLLGPCRSGRGGIALLTGDAGSGKSRLLVEVGARVAAEGTTVVRGHAVPGGGAFRPLAEALIGVAPPSLSADERLVPFRSVLARVLPAWPAGSAAGSHLVDPVVVLGEAVLELLRVVSARQRCVLLLDDLHWADRDTLTLLEYLAGSLGTVPVRVLAAARSDEAHPEALRVLGRHPDVQVVGLPRIPPADVGALARAGAGAEIATDIEEYLVAAADGLPLLVEELFAGLVETGAVIRDRAGWQAVGPLGGRVPGAFAGLVARRMAVLGPIEREVLLGAAVLGRRLQWDLLPTVTGADTTCWPRPARPDAPSWGAGWLREIAGQDPCGTRISRWAGPGTVAA